MKREIPGILFMMFLFIIVALIFNTAAGTRDKSGNYEFYPTGATGGTVGFILNKQSGELRRVYQLDMDYNSKDDVTLMRIFSLQTGQKNVLDLPRNAKNEALFTKFMSDNVGRGWVLEPYTELRLRAK